MVALSDSRSMLTNMSTSPSLTFSATLPMNPSHTTTSAMPLKMSRPSMLPMKFRFRAFSRGSAALRQFVALVFLFADREQPHARPRIVENGARVDLAHHRELRQHFRLAIDVGADVQQHHAAIPSRTAVPTPAPAGSRLGSFPGRSWPSPSPRRYCPPRPRPARCHRAPGGRLHEWRSPS